MQDMAGVVAANIRAELARRRISRKTLSEQTGLSIKALTPRLQGKKDFTVGELRLVADVVGVHAADLLGSQVV